MMATEFRARRRFAREGGDFLFRDRGVAEGLSGFDLVDANTDQANRKRNLGLGFFAFGRELEVVEVVPAVDNLKDILLGAPGFNFVLLQQTRAATDHLPELRVGEDRFGEDEIDDLADVNAGIEHIHADGNAGHVTAGELVEQAAFP